MAATGRRRDFITHRRRRGRHRRRAAGVRRPRRATVQARLCARVLAPSRAPGLAEDVVFIGSGSSGFPDSALLRLRPRLRHVQRRPRGDARGRLHPGQRCHTGRCPTGVATQSRVADARPRPQLKSVAWPTTSPRCAPSSSPSRAPAASPIQPSSRPTTSRSSPSATAHGASRRVRLLPRLGSAVRGAARRDRGDDASAPGVAHRRSRRKGRCRETARAATASSVPCAYRRGLPATDRSTALRRGRRWQLAARGRALARGSLRVERYRSCRPAACAQVRTPEALTAGSDLSRPARSRINARTSMSASRSRRGSSTGSGRSYAMSTMPTSVLARVRLVSGSAELGGPESQRRILGSIAPARQLAVEGRCAAPHLQPQSQRRSVIRRRTRARARRQGTSGSRYGWHHTQYRPRHVTAV